MTFGQVAKVMRRHLLLVLACWVTVVAGTVFFTLGQAKVYRAEAMLRLNPDPPRPLGQKVELVAGGNNNYWNRREFYETEFRIIRSMRVAVGVVKMLNLNADPAFNHAKSREQFASTSVDEAAQLLLTRITLEPVKESSLVSVRYEDTDPKRCETILSALLRVYLEQNLEANATVSTSALEWLNTQLDHLKTDLEKSEGALNDFRQKNNVLSISLEDRNNMVSSEVETLSKESTNLQTKRDEAASRHRELAKLNAKDPTEAGASELLSSPVLSGLRTSYNEQQSRLGEMLATLDVNNPRVLSAQERLKATAGAIEKEIENVRRAAAGDVRRLDQQLGQVKKREADALAQAHELQALAVTYNQLNRTRGNNEKIYQLVMERAQETDLTRVMNFNNIRISDAPLVGRKPVRPNVPVNIAVGAVLGAVVGLLAAFVRHVSDQSLKTPADVEEFLGTTCLGILPDIEAAPRRGRGSRSQSSPTQSLGERDLIVARRPESGIAEAARAIRTNLTFSSPDRPYRAIAVTSAIPEEGKTTCACSLAIVLAQSGYRVLLVDTDLRRPRIHRSFRMPNNLGVSLVVSGQASLEECVQKSEVENLDLLTSGPIPPNPAEMLQSERFRDLVSQLKERYDRVVFDTPPVLPVTDAAIMSQLVDGSVLVVRGFRTSRIAVRQAVRTLFDLKSHVIGVVLNAIDLSRFDYHEYHYYYKRDRYYSARTDVENHMSPDA